MDWQTFRLSTRLVFDAEFTEYLYSTIAQIDGIKNSWGITSNLQPQVIKRLSHHVIITSSGASNRIEGNHLTDKEVEKLYRNMRIKQFVTRDEQEVAGYIEALEIIFKNYHEIAVSESSILQLHRDMLRFGEKDGYHRGAYKTSSNRVEAKDHTGKVVGIIFDPTPLHLVNKEMQELIAWYQWAVEAQFKHPIILLANFIFEYLAIHPFQDGNGRTSRLLTNLMLLKNDYTFTSLVSHERLIEARKAYYYLALNKTQRAWKTEKEDMEPWFQFFFDIMKWQSEEALNILETDQVENLLSVNQLRILDWARTQASDTFSRKILVEAFDIPTRTIEASIKRLVDLNLIKKIGQGRSTRYYLI